MSSPIILDIVAHAALLPSLVELHINCVETDHMLATFLPPFDKPFMLKWWKASLEDPLNTTWVTISGPLPTVPLEEAPLESLPSITGVVQLRTPFSNSEPFTGQVFKLMVSPDARRQGIAKRLMAALEVEAERKDRPLLTLDTEVGSAAEMVYPRIGYTRVGVVPNYGISPKDGRLVDEVFFWKDLRKVEKLSG